MNLYRYFAQNNKNLYMVAGMHRDLWLWTKRKVLFSSLSLTDAQSLLYETSKQLHDEEVDRQEFQTNVMEQIHKKSRSWIQVGIEELLDFPIYLFVYITVCTVLYDPIVSWLMSGIPVDGWIQIGPSLLIRTVAGYLIMKILILLFAYEPDRSQFRFWIVLMLVFAGYLVSLSWASFYQSIGWFSIPIWLWTVLSLALWLSVEYQRKRK